MRRYLGYIGFAISLLMVISGSNSLRRKAESAERMGEALGLNNGIMASTVTPETRTKVSRAYKSVASEKPAKKAYGLLAFGVTGIAATPVLLGRRRSRKFGEDTE